MVSKRRLPPANGHSNGAKVVLPKFKEGDRARRLPNGPSGIVVQVERQRVLMYWGTTSYPHGSGMVEKRFEDWVPKIELELMTEPVISPDEVIKRQAMGRGGG